MKTIELIIKENVKEETNMFAYDDVVELLKEITTTRCSECICNDYSMKKIKQDTYLDTYDFYFDENKVFEITIDYNSNRYKIKAHEIEQLKIPVEAAYASFIFSNGEGLYTRFRQYI